MTNSKDKIEQGKIDPMGFSSWNMGAQAPEKVTTPGVDPAHMAYDNLHWISKLKIMLKPNGKIRRFLTGKSKAGRIFYSVLDVLPIPNIHEVVKRVIKDSERQGQVIGGIEIIRDTLKRLDWIRTIGAGVVAILLIRAVQWSGVDMEVLLRLIERISEII